MKCQHSWLFTALYLALQTTAFVTFGKRAAIDDCLKNFKVPVYTSNSNDWNQAIKPFNLRVTFKPAAYAVPKTVQHVQDAVACGVQNGITVTAESGGHSYASHGLGGGDGHLIVDLKKFKNVDVNQTAQTAVIGAGGRLGNIALALYNQGKHATSHGTCPGVGIGGLSLHGDYGLISRLKGLSLDNLLEAAVVLANSTVVNASATQNTDLFWALRGAGAAFGIVTSFKFNTFTAPENNIIVFTYNLQPSNTQQLATMLEVLQNFTMNTQPPELNMRLFVPSLFTGVYHGNRTSFDALMNPLLSSLGVTNSGAQVATKGWIDTLLSNSDGALEQKDPYDTHETFYAKSLMPSFLPKTALTALADYYFTTARNLNRGCSS